jgi:hypothetical protein
MPYRLVALLLVGQYFIRDYQPTVTMHETTQGKASFLGVLNIWVRQASRLWFGLLALYGKLASDITCLHIVPQVVSASCFARPQLDRASHLALASSKYYIIHN